MKQTVLYRGSVCFEKHPTNFLKDAIISLRDWFKGEIIISTWQGQEKFLTGINDIDKVVLSKDPGPGPVQQIYRQIISYEKGLDAANGNQIMVTRTDFVHKIDLFKFLNEFPLKTNTLSILKNKILIGNIMSIRPDSKEYPNTFRLCDWFQVGLREDIENWGRVYKQFNSLNYFNSECTEKIWTTAFLRKNGINNITPADTSQIDAFYWHYITNNFIVKNTNSTLQSFNKNWEFLQEKQDCYITEKLYEQEYNRLHL